MNSAYISHHSSKVKVKHCLRSTFEVVGDYYQTGKPFVLWLTTIALKEIDFDLTPYI